MPNISTLKQNHKCKRQKPLFPVVAVSAFSGLYRFYMFLVFFQSHIGLDLLLAISN